MNKTLIVLSLVLLASCAPNEVPFGNLVERQGVTYEINSQTPFTGTSVRYHDNGQLEFKRNWKDGKRVGLSEWYHENGQLKSKSNWKDGKRVGLSEWYHENGQLWMKGNAKDGLVEWYYENGGLKSKVCYKNGEKTDMSYCEK